MDTESVLSDEVTVESLVDFNMSVLPTDCVVDDDGVLVPTVYDLTERELPNEPVGVEIGEDFLTESPSFSLIVFLTVSVNDFLVTKLLSMSLLLFFSETISSKLDCVNLTGVVDNISSSLGLPAAGEKELDAELNGDTSNDEVESWEMSYGESLEDNDSQQLSFFFLPLAFVMVLVAALLAFVSHECSRHFFAVILLLQRREGYMNQLNRER